MKMPKFVLRVCGHEFLVPHNKGVASLMALLADAVPVHASLYKEPPEIELAYEDDPRVATMLTEVRIERIPRGVRWKRKAADGTVVEVRPVTKAAKALPAPKPARLNGRKQPALTAGGQQLALGWTE